MAAATGGHVRIKLKDVLENEPDRLACSNAEKRARARQIIEGLRPEIATPYEAREVLILKGGGQVEY